MKKIPTNMIWSVKMIIFVCIFNRFKIIETASPRFIWLQTSYDSKTSENDTFVVYTSVYLERISSIKLKEADFRMDYFMIQEWNLSRVKCNRLYLSRVRTQKDPNSQSSLSSPSSLPSEYQRNLFGRVGDRLFIERNAMEDFWIPNSYAADAKTVKQISAIVSNDFLNVTVGVDSCHIRFSTRMAAVVGCKMDFREYPNDVQHCPFRLTSFFRPNSAVKFRWMDPPVRYKDEKIDHNHYEISFTTDSYKATGFDEDIRSWLVIKFVFRRKIGHFIYQAVIPSILIVIAAYFSFWIGVEAGPGRFLFTACPFFSLITLYSGLKEQLPPVSYVNGSDIWMLATLFFTFLAICGMTLSVYYTQIEKKEAARIKCSSEHKLQQSTTTTIPLTNESLEAILEANSFNKVNNNVEKVSDVASCNCPRCRRSTILRHFSLTKCKIAKQGFHKANPAEQLDNIMRIVYPILFISFNLVYWVLILSSRLLS